MSTFDWSLTGFEERWFHALACILERTCKQQDPSHISAASRLGEDEKDVSDSESDDNAATITPRNIARTVGKRKLLEKFLDRLAETLAHEVRGDKKAHDVCAVALHENDGGAATIYIAKNRTLTDEDRSFMRKLQVWLQSIAKIGVRRDFQMDVMWKTLVEWNVQRLFYYRDQLGSSFQALGIVCSTKNISPETKRVAKKLALVQAFCEETSTAGPELAIELWGECITLCYELRYEPDIVPVIMSFYQSSGVVDIQSALRLKRSVEFFGRLRSAYETFIEFALQFSSAKTVLIQPVEEPPFLQPGPYERSELSRHIAESGIDLMQLRIKDKRKLVKKQGKILGIILRDITEPVKVHAEIKLLLFFSGPTFQSKSKPEKSTYIGCSKRPCFLCWHILQGMPGFSTRGSHGKIYSRWTIPSTNVLTAWSSLRLHAAISKIGNSMLEELRKPKGKSREYIPESTVDVTEASAAVYQRRHRTQLDRERRAYKPRPDPETKIPMFGPTKYTVRTLLIPASGSQLSLVDVPIRPALENYEAQDRPAQDVPDFGEFWPEALNFERGFPISCEVKEQESVQKEHECLNGQYRLYFSNSEELEPNKFLRKEVVQGDIPLERKFWNGDVFLLRLRTRLTPRVSMVDCDQGEAEMLEVEHDERGATMYENVPDEILQSDFISKLFRSFWEEQQLENEMERDKETKEFLMQHETNKDLIRARLNEDERKVLDLITPGFIDILAMEEGDYGARVSGGVRKDPNNANMYIIEEDRRIETLEKMGWEGFSSQQL